MSARVLTIVGAGLIGGSIGLAVKNRRLFSCVRGLGRRPESLEEALSIGAIDEAHLDKVGFANHYERSKWESEQLLLGQHAHVARNHFDRLGHGWQLGPRLRPECHRQCRRRSGHAEQPGA